MSTLWIVALMLAGILLGWLIFASHPTSPLLKLVGRLQQVGTAALLFTMGIWLGDNEEFWGNLAETGLHGLLFSVACVAGSIALVVPLCRVAFGKAASREKP